MKNRVIKFRAWDKNGILRFGLLRFHYDTWLINDTIEVPPSLQDPCGDMRYEEWAIDPQTIGQFTGLTDKNGVEIFEGDVVKWDDDSDGKYWRVCEIRWVKSGFQLFGHTFYSKAPNEKKPIHFRFGQFIYEYDGALEVIGNIYQNPAHSEIGKDGGR